jgi:transcriptional regulator with XRE-family HTH domain
MSDFGNKEVFSENLKRYIELSGKTRRMIIDDLGFKESAFNGWCRGEYYPRIDKIEKLADYFGCTKADLIEKQSETYAAYKEVKNLLDNNGASAEKHELIELIIAMDDKDVTMLLTLAKQLKGRS